MCVWYRAVIHYYFKFFSLNGPDGQWLKVEPNIFGKLLCWKSVHIFQWPQDRTGMAHKKTNLVVLAKGALPKRKKEKKSGQGCSFMSLSIKTALSPYEFWTVWQSWTNVFPTQFIKYVTAQHRFARIWSVQFAKIKVSFCKNVFLTKKGTWPLWSWRNVFCTNTFCTVTYGWDCSITASINPNFKPRCLSQKSSKAINSFGKERGSYLV